MARARRNRQRSAAQRRVLLLLLLSKMQQTSSVQDRADDSWRPVWRASRQQARLGWIAIAIIDAQGLMNESS
ncbi:hypothetical protein LY76DRAFT_593813 [Colletotrichum caudatum]|nr:hypothetical protein LY76DRAFT_593813 [Colletotrichum caudatum]